jgi:hypothetical protein
MRDVRSPITGAAADHPRHGESPGAFSNPTGSRFRADSGHLSAHIGKSTIANPKLLAETARPTLSPAQGQPPGVIPDRRR